jgi:DNA repair protein RecN (Recombination protein N)
MLSRIEIRDFALIDQAIIELTGGLLVISGETGAGKSILIDAIGALTGGRIQRDVIRYGQSRAAVEAVFRDCASLLPADHRESLGIEDDDIILSREINDLGKGICRINGRLVSQSVLRQTAGYLIDIHGQNDQQTIFQQETHGLLLDRFGGSEVAAAVRMWKNRLEECISIKKELQEFGDDPAELARKIDLLKYQVNEIENARIKPNEEEKLTKRKKILSSLERIQEGIAAAVEILDSEQAVSVSAEISRACGQLEFAARFSDEIKQCMNELAGIADQVATYSGDLRSLSERYQSQPDELNKIESRLDLFYNLKKKYGGSLEAVGNYLEKAREKLDRLTDSENNFEKLNQRLNTAIVELKVAGNLLYTARRAAADTLEQRIAAELKDLGMKNVKFAVQINKCTPEVGNISRQLDDQILFMISANPGEPLKPLARVASGGEASRVLLAVKTILADVDDIPVLIFDEIDSGISGHTAGMVADKLKQLSGRHQVMCITHMAQIASQADQHLLIEKFSDGKITYTRLTDLDKGQRQSEIARLLSGGIASKTAHDLAGQMLETNY